MKRIPILAFLVTMLASAAMADSSWGGAGNLQQVTTAGATTTTAIAWGGGYGSTGCTGTIAGDIYCDGTVFSMPNATATFSTTTTLIGGGLSIPLMGRINFDYPTNTIYMYGDTGLQKILSSVGHQSTLTSGVNFVAVNSGNDAGFRATHTGSGYGFTATTSGSAYGLVINANSTNYPIYVNNTNAAISTMYLASAASSTEFVALLDSNSTVGGDVLKATSQIDGGESIVALIDSNGHAGFGADIALTDLATDTVYASGTIAATGGFKTSTTGDAMDSYDESMSWTPTATATVATCTNSVRVGTYQKVGNHVYVDFRVTTTACSGTGNFYITALPFTSTTTTNYMSGCTITYFHNFALAAGYVPTAVIGANSTSIELYQFNPGGSASTQVGVDTDGFTLGGFCHYTTDS